MLHLGDYIYEYQNGISQYVLSIPLLVLLANDVPGEYGYGQTIDRIPLPDRTIFTLYDYRKRIATYRTDLDLLLSHQTFPWVS